MSGAPGRTDTTSRARHASRKGRGRRAWLWVLLGLSLVGGAVAVAAAAWAWTEPMPDLTRDDARRFTADALAAAGFDDLTVDDLVTPGVFVAAQHDERAEVWITTAVMEGQTVEMRIDRETPQALLIDDNTPDGPLLDEDQFAAVDEYMEHPRRDERLRRNYIATAAAVVTVVVAVVLMVVAPRRLRTPA
jgi:hypothetical protein